MTNEVTYEQLTALMVGLPVPRYPALELIKHSSAQNGVCRTRSPPMADRHASKAYTKPRYEVIKKTFERLSELSKNGGDLQIVINLEYIPVKKVVSVPGDATALGRRQPCAFVLSIVRWTENTPENLKKGRSASYELADMVSKGNGDLTEADGVGFGMYGKWPDYSWCVIPAYRGISCL